LTFPNPVIASFDKKLNQHLHRTDVIQVPFWSDDFVNSIVERPGTEAPVNRKDALTKWLETDAQNLTSTQSLIIDGSTFVEESYHKWFKYNEHELALAKSGKINDYAEWNYKKSYFEDLFNVFKTLKCNIIYICHESPDRDDKGRLNGKLRPLMTGQVGDKMAGNFTDWFRMKVCDKPTTKEARDELKKRAGIDDETLEEWIKSVPENYMAIHLLQTQDDDMFSGGSSSLFNAPKFVLANYSVFNKYKRKP